MFETSTVQPVYQDHPKNKNRVVEDGGSFWSWFHFDENMKERFSDNFFCLGVPLSLKWVKTTTFYSGIKTTTVRHDSPSFVSPNLDLPVHFHCHTVLSRFA